MGAGRARGRAFCVCETCRSTNSELLAKKTFLFPAPRPPWRLATSAHPVGRRHTTHDTRHHSQRALRLHTPPHQTHTRRAPMRALPPSPHDTGRALAALDRALLYGHSDRIVALASDLRARLAADRGLDAASPSAAVALADVLQGRGRSTRAFELLVRGDATGAAAVAYARLLPRDLAPLRRALLRAAAVSPSVLATVAASDVVSADDMACALLASAGKTRDAVAVGDVVAAAVDRGCTSAAVLNAAIGAWVDVGQPQAAFHTYATFRWADTVPETRTFNGLLRACRAAKDAARASRLYARMVRLGPPPDTVTVSVVLSAVATGGTVNPDWAVAAFQRGGVRAAADPGAVAALAYALRCGPSPPPQDAADAAFDAFDVLRSEYRAADAWATAEILHLAAAAGAPARARSAWTAAVGDNVAPTPHMYSALFVAAATAAAQSADAALVTLADRAGARLRRDWDREVAAAAPPPPTPAHHAVPPSRPQRVDALSGGLRPLRRRPHAAGM